MDYKTFKQVVKELEDMTERRSCYNCRHYDQTGGGVVSVECNSGKDDNPLDRDEKYKRFPDYGCPYWILRVDDGFYEKYFPPEGLTYCNPIAVEEEETYEDGED